MAGKKKSVSEQLTTSLNGLQAKADQQTRAYQSSREILYQNLVDTYIWWRDARDEPGYLESLYEQHSIQVNRTSSNKPNFSGIIRLIWGMRGSKHQVTISKWNGALGIIDDEYIENKARYRKNPKTLLINYIEDNGGLTQLRENKGWVNDDSPSAGAPKKPKQKADIDKKQRDAQLRDGIRFFKSTAKPIATVATGNPIVATADDLVAVLAKRNSKGELEILATSDNDEYVNMLAASCAVEDISNAPSNVTTLVKAIATTSLPFKMRSMAKRLTDKSKFKREDDEGKKHAINLTTRLTMRPKRNDILVSLSRTDVSVVTRLKPTNPLKNGGNDLFLKGDLTGYLRRTYVYEKSLQYIKAKPSQRITKAGDEYVASHLIEVTNTESKHQRNLYFYNPAGLFEEQRFQADYNDKVKFVALWTLDVSPNWLHSLNADSTSIWINKHSQYATRPAYAEIELTFTDKAWRTAFSFRNGSYEHSPKTLFDKECKVRLTGLKQSFKALSKDYITVLNALHESRITSRKIRIEGNHNVMRIAYKTKQGEYEIFIPASTSAMHRDETFFKRYEYV
jgi:hypothetical protein